MEILERVRATIRERNLLPPEGGVVIVGYSGGADSTALLHLLTRLQEELRIRVHAAHLHHGMRPEADADVQVCQAVCEQLGVPLHVERVDVPALAKQEKISLEEAGRNARYAFFERLANELNAVAVALAHTRDDQIETILINLLRGTGPRGLCGMPYKRDRIIRPLLDASREQTHRYCAEQNLPTVFDSTNLDPHQMRRRVRMELIPLLREIAPAFDRHLLRLADILEHEEAWWEEEVGKVLQDLGQPSPPVPLSHSVGQDVGSPHPRPLSHSVGQDVGSPHPRPLSHAVGEGSQLPLSRTRERGLGGEGLIELPRPRFTALHPALQRRVLREWLRPHLGTLNLPPFEILEGIRRAAIEGKHTSWQLSDALRLTTDENALRLHFDAPTPKPYEYPALLETPILIPEAGMWLELRSTDIPVRAEPMLGLDSPVQATSGTDTPVRAGSGLGVDKAVQATSGTDIPVRAGSGLGLDRTVQATMDADAIQGQLNVRNARPGDRFQPLGMTAPKKLSDIFIDRKIPKAERRRLPLLCDEAGILWVPGYTIAERARITPHTKRVLQATLHRNASTE